MVVGQRKSNKTLFLLNHKIYIFWKMFISNEYLRITFVIMYTFFYEHFDFENFFWVASCLGGKYPGNKLPGWQMSGWQIAGWQVAGWQMSGWQVAGWQKSAHRKKVLKY